MSNFLLKERWAVSAHAKPVDFVGFTGDPSFGGVSACSRTEQLFWALDRGMSRKDVVGLAFTIPAKTRYQTFQWNGKIYELIALVGKILLREERKPIAAAKTFLGHTGLPLATAVNVKKGLLLSGGMDRTIFIWDLNGKILAKEKCAAAITALAIDEDARSLLIGDGDFKVRCYDVSFC